MAVTLAETEDLDNGVGELREAFPIEDHFEDSFKILSDAINTELSPEDQRWQILEFSGCFNNELQCQSEGKMLEALRCICNESHEIESEARVSRDGKYFDQNILIF